MIVDGVILNQSVDQDALVDPVKGHLWDIKEDKCLVHKFCDCSLTTVTSLFYLVGHAPFRVRYIKSQMDKLFNKLDHEVPLDPKHFQLYLEGKYLLAKPVNIEGEKDGVNGH